MPSTRIKPFQQEPVCLTSHFVRRPLPDRCRNHPARPIHPPPRVRAGPADNEWLIGRGSPPTAGAGGSVAGRSGGSKRWPARIFHPPPRTPPITKWRNDAVLRMRSAADAPESYAPATFSRPVFPPRRHPGPRRRGPPPVGRSGCGRAASPRPEPPQGSRGPMRRRRLPRSPPGAGYGALGGSFGPAPRMRSAISA